MTERGQGFSGDKILITGAQGQMGLALDKELSKRYETEVTTSKEELSSTKDGIHLLDFSNPDQINRVIADGGFHGLIHMIAVSEPAAAESDVSRSNQINRIGVRQMLEAVERLPKEKRPVVILACSILQFDIKESGIISIDHPLVDTVDDDPEIQLQKEKAAGVYVTQKNGMLHDAQEFVARGLDVRFAFLANTYYYGARGNLFGAKMMDQLIKGEKIIRHGPIEQKRPLLHGTKAAQMFAYALTELSSGDKFFVSAEKSIKLRSFIEEMIEYTGRTDAVIAEDDPNFANLKIVDDINFKIDPRIIKAGYVQQLGTADLCKVLMEDRLRVLKGIPLPPRGKFLK